MSFKFTVALLAIFFAPPAFAQSAHVVAQCKLLESAYKATKASGAQAHNDIVMGCPGYENWPASMTQKDNSKAFRLAMGAKKPDIVKSGGKNAKILFQQMISRGVPVEIAQVQTATPEFSMALANFGK